MRLYYLPHLPFRVISRIFMNQTELYEQLITQLVEQNLDRESFHVGERLLDAGEAATW